MKNTNVFSLGWMTASMALRTAAASALVFASIDANNSQQHHSLKKQQQLIEFQIQDEKIQTDESPSLTTESIVEQDNEQTKEPTEEIIQKNSAVIKSSETADRQLATSPIKNKTTTLPNKKVSTAKTEQKSPTTDNQSEPQYVVMAPVATASSIAEETSDKQTEKQTQELTQEQEVLDDPSQNMSAIANNSSAEEALDIPEPQPVEISKPTTTKNTTSSAGPAIAINNNQDSASNIRTLEQLKQVPGNEVPKYNSDDRFHKRQGDVTFWAYVNKQGSLEKFKLVESTGFRELDFKTLRVLRSWKFYPGQEGWVEIPYSWSLKGEAQIKPTPLRRSSEL